MNETQQSFFPWVELNTIHLSFVWDIFPHDGWFSFATYHCQFPFPFPFPSASLFITIPCQSQYPFLLVCPSPFPNPKLHLLRKQCTSLDPLPLSLTNSWTLRNCNIGDINRILMRANYEALSSGLSITSP